jgi:hypothetical protein
MARSTEDPPQVFLQGGLRPNNEPALGTGRVTGTVQVTLIGELLRAPVQTGKVHAESIAGIRQVSQRSAETGTAGNGSGRTAWVSVACHPGYDWQEGSWSSRTVPR